MILHKGERVFWGAPEVIYLEGIITALNEQEQTVVVHVERATPYSAHLINTDLPFAANGVKPLKGDSPPGTISERARERIQPPEMSDDEKIHRAAAVAVHEQYGYTLPAQQEETLIKQVGATINNDQPLRKKIIDSMNEILKREF